MKIKPAFASIFLGVMVAATTISTTTSANDGIRLDMIDEFGKSPYRVAQQFHSEYKRHIYSKWNPPRNAKGAYVKVKMTINKIGAVEKPRIETLNDELRLSMEEAIQMAQPFPLPRSKEAIRLTRSFETTFFVK